VNEVYWIEPNVLAGRPGPDEVPWNLQALWDAGFRTIVSLTPIDGTPIRAAEFNHYRRPLNGGLAFFPILRRRLARQMLPIVDFIAEEIEAGRPVLVHCQQGRDRTGAVLAAYLIKHMGLTPEEALDRLREANAEAMASPGFALLPAAFASLIEKEK
jgi:atypical dual specificity phosphatase